VDGTSMCTYYPVDNSESEAATATFAALACRIAAVETFKNVWEMPGCDPFACITNANTRVVLVSFDSEQDISTSGSIDQRIIEQIHDGLNESSFVSLNDDGFGGLNLHVNTAFLCQEF